MSLYLSDLGGSAKSTAHSVDNGQVGTTGCVLPIFPFPVLHGISFRYFTTALLPIIEPKRGGGTGGWKKLHTEDALSLYPCHSVAMVTTCVRAGGQEEWGMCDAGEKCTQNFRRGSRTFYVSRLLSKNWNMCIQNYNFACGSVWAY
jgi:hypothetical protein